MSAYRPRILVTAGPTREAIDPVRFLSNRSSGRMGYAIAHALLDQGYDVLLVSGPVALPEPEGITLLPVESAREMAATCRNLWGACDGLVAAAAVADYRPRRVSRRKLKRVEGEGTTLELVPNPDIVRRLARGKGERKVLGFALESSHREANARRKLVEKRLDWVALNGPEAQGAWSSSLLLLGADGERRALGPAAKEDLARELVAFTFGPAKAYRWRAASSPR